MKPLIEITLNELGRVWDVSDSIEGNLIAISKLVNSRLEKLFEGAEEVFGFHEQDGIHEWSYKQERGDTHKAILLKPEPIKRGVTKEEAAREIRLISDCIPQPDDSIRSVHTMLRDLADRIEKEGIV